MFIGPDDVALIIAAKADNEGKRTALLTGSDGHTIWRDRSDFPRPEAFDDQRFYISRFTSDDNENGIMTAFDLEGRELWEVSPIYSTTGVRIVEERGIAICEYGGSAAFLTEYGERTGEIHPISGTSWGDPGHFIGPVFDRLGAALWLEDVWRDAGSTDYVSSELHPEPVRVCTHSRDDRRSYSPAAAIANPNGLIFCFVQNQVTVFTDAYLQTILWSYILNDAFIYGYCFCSDPFNGCYLISGEQDGSNLDGFDLVHLNEEGELDWRIELQRSGQSYDGCAPICDPSGNVYLTKAGTLLSYSPSGELRWRLEVTDYRIYVGPMNSGGAIYCHSWYEDTDNRLFAIGDGPPHHSRVRAKLPERSSGNIYSPGEELTVQLQPYNFGEDEAVDGYLALLLPDGSVFYYTGSSLTAIPTAWFSEVFMPNSFEMIDAPVSLGIIPGGIPEGAYTIIPAFCEPGTQTPVDEIFPITIEVVQGSKFKVQS
ncbi:MAG: hypothetical protein JW941_07195 [Candidatus Coatesbacteria bacterium]|nr:hypothetical protein [Candidatus Coatesbacteria bacterium]